MLPCLSNQGALQALWASKHLSASIQQEHANNWGLLNDMCHSLMTPLQVPHCSHPTLLYATHQAPYYAGLQL